MQQRSASPGNFHTPQSTKRTDSRQLLPRDLHITQQVHVVKGNEARALELTPLVTVPAMEAE